MGIRLQQKLHGETPRAEALWDTETVFRPKSEPRLSNYIKAHLEDDLEARGIIVNREVEIRRVSSRGTGESSDIHIKAKVKDKAKAKDGDIVTVVVEVKGCWNRGLLTDMEKQLKERYLEGVTKYGLYLVCWFASEKWDDQDERKRRCGKWTIEELKSTLEAKAKRLSVDGLRIRTYVLDCSLPG